MVLRYPDGTDSKKDAVGTLAPGTVATRRSPCGEALTRNLLHGIACDRALTSTAPIALWPPQCLGCSACLPSAMHQVVLRGCFSIKMF
jgi:hypothetical protein